MKNIIVVTSFALLFVNALGLADAVSASQIHIPDYAKHSPFTIRNAAIETELKSVVTSQRANAPICEMRKVKVLQKTKTDPNEWIVPVKSNICDKILFDRLTTLITTLAPSLNAGHIGFWVYETNKVKAKGLIVTHLDLSADTVKYPYLSVWSLDWHNDKLNIKFKNGKDGSGFLNGGVYGFKQFGNSGDNNVVLIKHVSCLECEAIEHVTFIDFSAPEARSYEFTQSEDHKDFGDAIEYSLPGEGHTVDAEVETRVLSASKTGPHLLQLFKMTAGEGPNEWWTYTCKDFRCDYNLVKANKAPADFLKVWSRAKKL